MKNKNKITLWDSDPIRIDETSRNIETALLKTKEKYVLEVMSEIPLIGRKGLKGRLPVLEIRDRLWHWKTGEAIPEHAVTLLLEHLRRQTLPCEEHRSKS